MTELRFSYFLEDTSTNSPWKNHGPLFTRWLPNGEEDAIHLPLKFRPGSINLWFYRYGYTDSDGFISFDYERSDIDESVMRKQGILDAGPVLGNVLLENDISKSLRCKIENQVKNDKDVTTFTKKIVKEINAKLSLLVDVLKYRYGQYWLPTVDRWDSRDYPLGVYCKNHLQLKLVTAKGQVTINPDDKPQTINAESLIRNSFPEYLTKKDWINIQKNLPELDSDLYIYKTLTNAHMYFLEGDHKSAIVFGCTALEIAIEHYYDFGKLPEELRKHFSAFQNLPLKTQAITVLISGGATDRGELVTYFVDMRNKIVHEGFEPPSEYQHSYRDFLECIAELFMKQEMKLPDSNHGNILLGDDET